MINVTEAHIPTWLKLKMSDAAQGVNRMTYADVGWHLGRFHPETFELEERGLGDVTEEEIAKCPSQTLRRLFRSDEHPRAEFVDLIPPKRRREFLRGLVYGLADEPFPERED
jgi:hypothetical protein